MPSANINKEIQTAVESPDIRRVIQLLGEVYSNKNLALNARVISSDTTLTSSDSLVMVDTSGGAITITLALANSWGSRDVYKTPIIIIRNLGASSVILSTSGSDSLGGSNLVYPGETKVLIADGSNSVWSVIASNLGYTNATITQAISTTDGSIESNTGTITLASGSVTYQQDGAFYKVRVSALITTNGTGGGYIRIAMPFSAGAYSVICGREIATTGKMLEGVMASGGSDLVVVNYDNTYPAASGYNLVLTGLIYA